MPSVGSSRIRSLGCITKAAGDGELLLLTAGKIAAAPPEHLAQDREEFEDLVRDLALTTRQHEEAALQVLPHGQQREDLAALGHIGQTEARELFAAVVRNVGPVPGDFAGGGMDLADDRPQQAGFADAVAAQQAR